MDLYYCRTCLTENIKLKYSLFENNLLYILEDCTSIKLDISNQELSTSVCEKCFSFIKQIEQFKKNCLKNEDILENKFNSENYSIKKEPPEDLQVEFKIGDIEDFKNEFESSNDANFESSESEDNLKHTKTNKNYQNKHLKKSNKNETFCKYCNQTFVDLHTLRRHNTSKKHKLVLMKYIQNKNNETETQIDCEQHNEKKDLENQIKQESEDLTNIVEIKYFKKDSNEEYYCEYCNETNFESLISIHDHYFKVHHDLLAKKYLVQPLEDNVSFCFICNKICKKQPILKYHCTSKEHKIKAGLVKIETIRTQSINDKLLNENYKKDEYGHFCCEQCNLLFVDQQKLELHLQTTMHESFVKKVIELDLGIEDLKNLTSNLIKVKNEESQSPSVCYCNFCETFFSSQQHLDVHLKSFAHKLKIENSKNVKIADCKIDETILNDQEVEKQCKLCHISFKNLKKHTNSNFHKASVYQLNLAARRAQSQLVSNKVHFCKICNVALLTKKRYLKHLNSEQHKILSRKKNKDDGKNADGKYLVKIPKYQCEECNFTYFSKTQYNSHLFSHINGLAPANDLESLKGEKCVYCDRRFSRKFYLIKHINYHDGILTKDKHIPKEVICYICGLKIKFINTHLAEVHHIYNNTKIKCKLCPEANFFESRDILLEHLKSVHNTSANKKRVMCPTCGASLTKKNLSRHIRQVHFDVRLFQCDVCQKKFKDKCYLKEHYRSHTDERPYSCEICSHRFRSKTTLKKHIYTHTGVRFPCDLCGKTFSQKSCLSGHKKIEHPVLIC